MNTQTNGWTHTHTHSHTHDRQNTMTIACWPWASGARNAPNKKKNAPNKKESVEGKKYLKSLQQLRKDKWTGFEKSQ